MNKLKRVLKRSIKNFIMIILLCLIVSVIIFTMYKARDSLVVDTVPLNSIIDINSIVDNKIFMIFELTNNYYIIFGTFSFCFGLVSVYLGMSLFNSKSLKDTFNSDDKVIIYILSTVIVTLLCLMISIFCTKKFFLSTEVFVDMKSQNLENDYGVNVTDNYIDLNNYNSNINIESGEYTITGVFSNSIIVKGSATINLQGVSIIGSIINESEDDLIINLIDDSINILNSEDFILNSNGNIIIQGNGILNIYGNIQYSKDITINSGNIYVNSGILNTLNNGVITINGGNVYLPYIDQKYSINGGTVVNLANNNLDVSLIDFIPNYLYFELENDINDSSLVILTNSSNEVVISFMANNTFNRLMICSDNLVSGEYHLYVNEVNEENIISIDGNPTFIIE